MTKLPPVLEALMPEPAVRAIYADAHNTPAVKHGFEQGGYLKSPDFFTATQMREAILAATERAAKKAFINALDDAYNAMFDLRGDKVTRFDAQTAIQKLKDAAAASTGRGEGGEGV